MFSMARNCSRADIFSLTPLKNCPSYSWQENVTRKIIINSNRVATPPLKSCKVLSLQKALPFAKECKYISNSSNHFWFTWIMKLVLRISKTISWEENYKKVKEISFKNRGNWKSWTFENQNIARIWSREML